MFDLHGSLFVALLPGNREIVLPSQTGHQPRPDQPQSGSHPGLPGPHFYPTGIGRMPKTLTVWYCTTQAQHVLTH